MGPRVSHRFPLGAEWEQDTIMMIMIMKMMMLATGNEDKCVLAVLTMMNEIAPMIMLFVVN